MAMGRSTPIAFKTVMLAEARTHHTSPKSLVKALSLLSIEDPDSGFEQGFRRTNALLVGRGHPRQFPVS